MSDTNSEQNVLAELTRVFLALELPNSDEELDSLLDTRDQDGFSNAWQAAWKLADETNIQERWLAHGAYAGAEAARKDVFLEVFDHTGSGDLAAYVSDDFDLICRNVFLALELGFVQHLLERYQQGHVPS